MSTIRSKVANALSFAHLAGFAGKARAEGDDQEDPDKKKDDEAKSKAKADEGEDDERKKREDESDDEYSARMKALDDEEKKKEEAKAEDDSDEEMRGDSTAAAARRRERARCAAIFGSTAAGKNPVLAANLAFNTSMSRTEALAVLDNTPAAAASGNPSRAARNPQVGAGGTVALTPQQVAAARWDQNLKAANPGRR